MDSVKVLASLAAGVFFALCPMPIHAKTNAPDLGVRTEYARTASGTWAAAWLSIPDEYYAYAHSAAATGKPTVLKVRLAGSGAPSSKVSFPVYYPSGRPKRDIFDPGETVMAYVGVVPLFVDMSAAEPGARLEGTLDLLLCSARHCLPVKRTIFFEPPAAPPAMDDLPMAALWRETVQTAPAVPAGDENAAPPVPSNGADRLTAWNFSPRFLHENLEVTGLGKALFLGLLAGLLLNVMPCVLPVLTLKAGAMLMLGSGDDAQRLRRFREYNLLFAAGVLTQFLLLAFFLGTAGRIWGRLFQSAPLVAGLLAVVFLLALSMLGLFTLPVVDLKADASRSPRLNAYVAGMLSTLLATPCSGPLLGGVLAWAFTQTHAVLTIVFLAVGAGMSLPYFFLALRPGLAALLPRPGPWMEILEKCVGFFLLGVCLYLLSILPEDRHLPSLAALLCLAAGGWIWGRFGGYDAPPARRRVLSLALVILTFAAAAYVSRPPEPQTAWAPYTEKSFRESLGNEPLLVEFTADWCPNCKLLERTVLTPERLNRWRQEYGLKLVRVDLTRDSPEAQNLLQALGGSSIPMTALFPRGPAAFSPLALRDIYTAESLEQALREAFSTENGS